MRLAIRQRQGRAPGAAKHQPLIDAELGAQHFDIVDQQLRRVVAPFTQRRGLAGAALVEQDHAVALRIEEAAVLRRQARARAAMQEQHGNAVGIAALFPVNGVDVIDRQHAVPVRRQGGKQG